MKLDESNERAQLLAIGKEIGFGRAQQILGELWDETYNCAPRGRTGVDIHQPNPTERVSDAARDVLVERARQINEEGFTPDRDDAYEPGTLATAAGCYGIWGWGDSGVYSTPGDDPKPWPWPRQWWKPSTLRRHCVKGAALYLAEIERIDRAARNAEIERQGNSDA